MSMVEWSVRNLRIGILRLGLRNTNSEEILNILGHLIESGIHVSDEEEIRVIRGLQIP